MHQNPESLVYARLNAPRCKTGGESSRKIQPAQEPLVLVQEKGEENPEPIIIEPQESALDRLKKTAVE